MKPFFVEHLPDGSAVFIAGVVNLKGSPDDLAGPLDGTVSVLGAAHLWGSTIIRRTIDSKLSRVSQ